MKALFRVLTVFLAIIAPAAQAGAFTSGVWEGGPDRDEDGRFIDCTMTAQSGTGILLAFVISREGAWGLALADERWALNVGAVEDVKLTIDASPPVGAIAKVVDPHGILVPLADDDRLVAAMRQGKTLTIATGTGEFRFELTGTSGALNALASCVTENLAAEKVKQEAPPRPERPGEMAAVDAKPDAPSIARENRLFTGEQASALARDLLAAAGVSGYRLADASDNPMPSFDVVWSYANGIVGAIAGFKHEGDADLEEVAVSIAADDATNCKGAFESGDKPVAPGAGKIFRFFTACRTETRRVEIHYTLIGTRTGNLVLIAHLNRGDGSLDVADADSAFLAAAPLRNIQ